MQERVEEFRGLGAGDKLTMCVEKAMRLESDLLVAFEKAEDFNAREAVFEWALTDYSTLQKMRGDFQPFNDLWTMMADFDQSEREWLTGPFSDLQAPKIEQEVMQWWKGSYRLMKQLLDYPKARQVDNAKAAPFLLPITKSSPSIGPCLSTLTSHWSML